MSAVMRLFVDTDVIIDSVGQRQPFEKAADRLLTLGMLKELELWIGPVQWLELYKWLVRGPDRVPGETARDILKTLLEFMNVCNATTSDLEVSLSRSWGDLPAACSHQWARNVRADGIITRDKERFTPSRLPVWDCDELLEYLAREKSLTYEAIDW